MECLNENCDQILIVGDRQCISRIINSKMKVQANTFGLQFKVHMGFWHDNRAGICKVSVTRESLRDAQITDATKL